MYTFIFFIWGLILQKKNNFSALIINKNYACKNEFNFILFGHPSIIFKESDPDSIKMHANYIYL